MKIINSIILTKHKQKIRLIKSCIVTKQKTENNQEYFDKNLLDRSSIII